MPKVIELDFRDAPPNQGGGSDRVPPGTYQLRVTKVSEPGSKSSTGKPQVLVTFRITRGEHMGKRIEDRFTFPVSSEDSLYPKQRLNAFLLCMGYPVPQDRGFKFDLETLIGRTIVADIVDNEIPATRDRPARIQSQVSEYEDVKKTAQAAQAAQNGAAAPAAPQAAAAVATAPEPPVALPEAPVGVTAAPADDVLMAPADDDEPLVAPPTDDTEFPFT